MARSADLKAKQHSIVRAAIVSLVLLASIYGTVYSLQPRLLMPAKIPNRSEFESRLSMAKMALEKLAPPSPTSPVASTTAAADVKKATPKTGSAKKKGAPSN
jgi:hypothetical protein